MNHGRPVDPVSGTQTPLVNRRTAMAAVGARISGAPRKSISRDYIEAGLLFDATIREEVIIAITSKVSIS